MLFFLSAKSQWKYIKKGAFEYFVLYKFNHIY